MAYRFAFVLLTTFFAGCCTTRDAATGVSVESYRSAITQLKTNLVEVRKDISDVDYDADIKKAHLQLIDASVALCDDTLVGKNAGGDDK